MSSLLFGEHRGYLADLARLRAYQEAIQRSVSPGATVLDLGSGTGVLGLFACRAGARHVYAVDGSPMLAVARQVLRANGVADRVTFVAGHSQAIELPERVDVVVADQLGTFGVEAGLFEAFADARRRHLAPGGVLVPGRVALEVAPVAWPERWAEVAFWDDGPEGVDLASVARLARHQRAFGTVEADHLLGPAAAVASLDPGDPGALPVRARVRMEVERAGELHGLAGWCTAELVPGVAVSTSPLAADRLQRSNVFLPIDEPVAVEPGHVVEAELLVPGADGAHRWSVEVRDGDGALVAASAHSTLEGMPLSREDLARTRPDRRPRLNRIGEARATLLSLCDGSRTMAELEDELRRRHPDLAPDPASAAAFVVGTLERLTD